MKNNFYIQTLAQVDTERLRIDKLKNDPTNAFMAIYHKTVKPESKIFFEILDDVIKNPQQAFALIKDNIITPDMQPYFNQALENTTKDPYVSYHLLATRKVSPQNMKDYFEKLLNSALQDKGNIFKLIYNEIITPDMQPYFDEILKMNMSNTYSARRLIQDYIIKKDSPYFNEIVNFSLDSPKEITTDRINAAYAYNLLSQGIIDKTSPFFEKTVKIAISDSSTAYELIKEETITENCPFFYDVIQSAIKDPEQAYGLIYIEVITSDMYVYYDEVLESAIKDPEYAYLLVDNGTIDNSFACFNEAIESAIKNSYYAYSLIKEGVIQQDSVHYDQAIKSALRENSRLLIKNNLITQSKYIDIIKDDFQDSERFFYSKNTNLDQLKQNITGKESQLSELQNQFQNASPKDKTKINNKINKLSNEINTLKGQQVKTFSAKEGVWGEGSGQNFTDSDEKVLLLYPSPEMLDIIKSDPLLTKFILHQAQYAHFMDQLHPIGWALVYEKDAQTWVINQIQSDLINDFQHIIKQKTKIEERDKITSEELRIQMTANGRGPYFNILMNNPQYAETISSLLRNPNLMNEFPEAETEQQAQKNLEIQMTRGQRLLNQGVISQGDESKRYLKDLSSEELKYIERKMGWLINSWYNIILEHVIRKAKQAGVKHLYMNTSKTVDGGLGEKASDFYYEKIPSNWGFKKVPEKLRGESEEFWYREALRWLSGMTKKSNNNNFYVQALKQIIQAQDLYDGLNINEIGNPDKPHIPGYYNGLPASIQQTEDNPYRKKRKKSRQRTYNIYTPNVDTSSDVPAVNHLPPAMDEGSETGQSQIADPLGEDERLAPFDYGSELDREFTKEYGGSVSNIYECTVEIYCNHKNKKEQAKCRKCKGKGHYEKTRRIPIGMKGYRGTRGEQLRHREDSNSRQGWPAGEQFSNDPQKTGHLPHELQRSDGYDISGIPDQIKNPVGL